MQDGRLSQCCTKELNHGGLHPEQLHSMTEHHMWPQVYRKLGSRQQRTFLVAQWLRLHASSARFQGSIPGQGARSHIPQPKVLHVITKDPAFCNEDERKISQQLRPGAVKYINFFKTFLKTGNDIAHFLTVYIDVKTIQASREWLLWKSKIRKGGYDPRRGTQASKVPAGFCFSNLCGSYTDVHFILMTEHIHIGLLFFCMNEILHNKNFN